MDGNGRLWGLVRVVSRTLQLVIMEPVLNWYIVLSIHVSNISDIVQLPTLTWAVWRATLSMGQALL